MNPLINNHISILQQIKTTVAQFSKEDYIEKLQILSGSSTGMHVRHIIEFYTCLLCSDSEVCYDNRLRNLNLETKPSSALEQIHQIEKDIVTLELSNSIYLKCNTDPNHSMDNMSKSTIKRELVYILDHTIHHLALIKIAVLNNFPYINLEENFGVAPSTIRYKKECAQ